MKRLCQQNRTYIRSALALTIFSLTIFKLIYPYPNMVLDSYYYILAAISKADVNAWAIGYSWFIRLVGIFSHSPLLFVIVQYFLLQSALLVFWLTFTSIFVLSKAAKTMLFLVLLANPISLYTANFVMADSLFISLSLVWISLLLWIVVKPNVILLWLHAFLILLVFSVRYNALYYPFVAAAAFVISGYSVRRKILGVILQLVVLGSFIAYTSFRVGQLSGQAQFSPFGNWKTANDALYMYGHVYETSRDTVPAKFAALDRSVRKGFKLDRKVDDLMDYTSPFYGSIYMFYYSSGLVQYKNLLYGEDTEFVNFRKMAKVGPLYGQYGTYLIRKYPVAFLRYFVVPNACRYVSPPLEAYGSFPPFFLRPDYLGQAAKTWFAVKTLTPSWSAIRLRGYLLSPYQTLACFVHLLFLINVIGFGVIKGYRSLPRTEGLGLLIFGMFWLFDLGFSLTAAAAVMRYELLPLIIECGIVVWATERIYFNDTMRLPL